MSAENQKIIRENENFRLETSLNGVLIVNKMVQPYRTMFLSFENLANLVGQIELFCGDVEKVYAMKESSTFKPARID